MTINTFPSRTLPLLLSALVAAPGFGEVEVLHAFSTPAEGVSPQSELMFSGGALFGSTLEGGDASSGTVFRLEPDGTGFSKLHDFDALSDPLGEGSFPSGRLAEIGGWLYGTAEFGGAAFDGVVYRVTPSGDAYEVVHGFDMNSAPAASPSGGVTINGSTLFGSTLFGSTLTEGALFTVNADGTGFSVLRELAADGSEGEEIAGPLAHESGVLWGVASFGGAFDGGTLFRYEVGPGTLSVLHQFGGAGDGATPVGGLLLDGGVLYGVTEEGGVSGGGTLFRIDADGTDYQTLHHFAGGATDGAAPVGGLTLVGDRLFGVTREAGPSDAGVVYATTTSGAGFELRHAFSGSDGQSPLAGLVGDGQLLYGTTSAGGLGGGVVYAIDPDALHGDYNGDGVVDAADYTVWRDTLGSTIDLSADGDFSGVIDAADYTLWAANYGLSNGAPAQAVPEPGTALLALWPVLAIVRTRRPARVES